MIPAYRYSQSSPMPIDLNYEDQTHLQLFGPNHQASSSSSSSSSSTSLSSHIFYNPDQVQAGFNYYWESKPLQSDEYRCEKMVPSSESYEHTTEEDENNLKLSTVWKKEEKDDEDEDEAENGSSLKWMSSKMRITQKMMVSDQTASDVPENTMHKFEGQKQSISPFGTHDSTDNPSFNSNFTVRVCSDCHTTRTPLWRSGPRGPKSLCNACGIRQRKARRAMAAASAAASANGAVLAADANPLKAKKLHHKEKKKSKIGCRAQLKKKRKLGSKPIIPRGRKKLGFEDFRIRLSKNLAIRQLVFPQDEKEAAILLMALSYGLAHG